ncbi:MAG: RNA pseudouridine synthase, partial [Gammaproteobacteria bacterium]|nr:RNA pseudouridine synthase [Gammaproteobacteria bacterium]
MNKSGSCTSVQVKEVNETGDGQRIDNFLIKTLKGVPKSRIYRAI